MRTKVLANGFWGLAMGAMTVLTGCAGFFSDPNTPSTSTTSSGADYVYVVNQNTDSLTGFVVGTDTLTTIATYALPTGLTPASVVVSIPDTFVYVGGSGAIECYSIGTGGVLTQVTGGGVTGAYQFISMDVSADGKWLVALDTNPLTPSVYVYSINTSTGALTLTSNTAFSVPGAGAVAQRQVKMSPNLAFIAAALGTGGDVLFSFNDTTGVPTVVSNVALAAGYDDNAAVFDPTSAYLMVARGGPTGGTSTIAAYSINSTSGALTAVNTGVASGNTPYSLVLSSTGSYVYAANRGDSTISGYTFSSGTLTQLGSSPFGSGSAVTALARDNSGNYVIAASSGGASDVTMYSFDAVTPGRLDAVATSTSGTDPADSLALATTH